MVYQHRIKEVNELRERILVLWGQMDQSVVDRSPLSSSVFMAALRSRCVHYVFAL